MKRFNTHWVLPNFERALIRAGASVLLAVFAISGSLGCVSRANFDTVSDEKAALAAEKSRLEEQLERLRSSNESLETERLHVLDSLESTSQQAADLQDRVDIQGRELNSLRTDVHSKSELIVLQKTELEAQREEVARLRGTYDDLVADLEDEVAAGQIEIEQLREGIRLKVSDELLFASGQSTLNKDGTAMLERVAEQLTKNSYRIEVQGHTDDRRIRGDLAKRFPSNWELAGARSASVARLLVDQGVEGTRVSSVSRAEFLPVADNATAEGRALNRRLEIRLLPTPNSRGVAAPDLAADSDKPSPTEP